MVKDIYGETITNTMKIIVLDECDTQNYDNLALGSFINSADSFLSNNTFINRTIMLGEAV